MENEEKFLEFSRTASERAGAFAGKVATIGSKIAGFASGGVSAGKEMLGLEQANAMRLSSMALKILIGVRGQILKGLSCYIIQNLKYYIFHINRY